MAAAAAEGICRALVFVNTQLRRRLAFNPFVFGSCCERLGKLDGGVFTPAVQREQRKKFVHRHTHSGKIQAAAFVKVKVKGIKGVYTR